MKIRINSTYLISYVDEIFTGENPEEVEIIKPHPDLLEKSLNGDGITDIFFTIGKKALEGVLGKKLAEFLDKFRKIEHSRINSDGTITDRIAKSKIHVPYSDDCYFAVVVLSNFKIESMEVIRRAIKYLDKHAEVILAQRDIYGSVVMVERNKPTKYEYLLIMNDKDMFTPVKKEDLYKKMMEDLDRDMQKLLDDEN